MPDEPNHKYYCWCVTYYDLNHGEFFSHHSSSLYDDKEICRNQLDIDLEIIKNQLREEIDNDEYFEENYEFDIGVIEFFTQL